MSELLDENSIMQGRRGQTLKVLAILSWVWIGLSTAGVLISTVDGPLTPEEMEMQRVELLESITPELMEVLGEDFILESMQVMEITNEYFYSLQGLNIANLVLGFYGVWLMFNLKKNGYYYYVAYTIIPSIISIGFFGTGFIVMFGVVFGAIIGGLFLILYGLQLKRMS